MATQILRKLFGLHPGEGYKATLFCLVALLWGIGGYGTLTLSEGMLLQHAGAHLLPYTYLFVALTFFLLSSLLIYALNHISVKNILLLVIATTISTQLLFYFLHPHYHQTTSYWVAYKVFGWITPVSIYISFWAFVDQYFDFQSGKRFFALFNAMLFLGDALGGATISYSIDFLGVRGLFLLFPLLILSSAFCISWLNKTISLPEEYAISPENNPSVSFPSLVKTMLSSRYTMALLIFYFSMQMLAIVTEFTYMEQFETTLKQNHGEHYLAQFLGNLGMWVSLVNMVFGMFIYSRVVRKVGVNNIILIAPACFMVLFLWWLGTPLLGIAIFGLVAREGMIYSLDDNNLNLLLAGVPSRIKNQVRFGVESFFEPAGMMISAFLLLCFQEQSKYMGMLLATLTLIFVFILRAYYTKAIFTNLVSSHVRVKQRAMDWFNQLSAKERKKAEFVLLYGLKQQGEAEQLLAFEHLLKLNNMQHLPHLINHLNTLSLPSKLKALELFGESQWVTEPALIKKLQWWTKTNSHPTFTSALYLYFARHGLLEPQQVMDDLEHEELTKKAASIITLKKASEEHPHHAVLATQKLRLLLDSDSPKHVIMGLKIIGIENNGEHASVLLPYLRHSSSSISREAAQSLAALAKKRLTLDGKALVKQLQMATEPYIRSALLQAIKSSFSLAMIKDLVQSSSLLQHREKQELIEIIASAGESALPILIALLEDHSLKDGERLVVAKIATKIDPHSLKRLMPKVIKKEIERLYFYYYHAHIIQKQMPEQNLYMLETILQNGYERIYHLIIQLLTLNGGIEESEVMVHSITSQHPKIRATAQETLEKITPHPLFLLIKPFFDDRSSKQHILALYLKQGWVPLSLRQLLERMIDSTHRPEQMVALHFFTQLRLPGWRKIIEEKRESHEELFASLSEEVLV